MPPALRRCVQGITALNRLLFYVAAVLMFVVVPVMLYEVVSRYAFNAPTTWGMELATLLFGPYFLLGGPYLLHLRGHVNLDLVRRALPARWDRALELVNHPVIILFCAILLVYSWPLAVQSWEFRETSFSAWNPPIWPVKFAVPAAVLLLALQSAAEFLRVLYRDPTAITHEPPAGEGAA
ncbi:TRAP transporter small permease subunit [Azospirillum halopraeferens]|uniref:TRAP transporter small permease subunit n=1 Tax=Azospirillum halopraeferens TaxID=34010 RepID=UPI0004917DFD|nr:TRAP transporter small permease subunit [Azospirillum halopraeferens]